MAAPVQERLAARIGAMALVNPVICGSGEPVMTESGIRAARRAGAAGVIATSANEQPAAAQQMDRADYLRARFTGFDKRIAADPAPPAVHDPSARMRWRDNRLAALRAHKASQPER